MKKISEFYWVAVHPNGYFLNPSMQTLRRHVIEWLNENNPNWQHERWRIAKLKVVEQ